MQLRRRPAGEIVLGGIFCSLSVGLLVLTFSNPGIKWGIDTRILAVVCSGLALFVLAHGIGRLLRERRRGE
ncbi:MAG: hypothetical protein INR66_25925 [Gordonia polyisoprenivorans]|nr:hypothetical protein [Gordonia polyisoprenivorans]